MVWIKKEGAIEAGIVEGNRDFSITLSGNLEFLKHYLLDQFFSSEAFKTGENGLVIEGDNLKSLTKINEQANKKMSCMLIFPIGIWPFIVSTQDVLSLCYCMFYSICAISMAERATEYNHIHCC